MLAAPAVLATCGWASATPSTRCSIEVPAGHATRGCRRIRDRRASARARRRQPAAPSATRRPHESARRTFRCFAGAFRERLAMSDWHVWPPHANPAIPVFHRPFLARAGDGCLIWPGLRLRDGNTCQRPSDTVECGRLAPGVPEPPISHRPDRAIVANCRRMWAVSSRFARADCLAPDIPVLHRQPLTNAVGEPPICPDALHDSGHTGAQPPAFVECCRRVPGMSASAGARRSHRCSAASFR